MEGISQEGRRRGPVTRSFLLTREAGWGEQGNQAGLCPLPAWLSERASKLQIGSGEYCCRGPVVIDPVFSSAWACLITFLTPLSERNIRVVGAKERLRESLVWLGEVALDLASYTHRHLAFHFLFFFWVGGKLLFFFFFFISLIHMKRSYFYLLYLSYLCSEFHHLT